MNNGISIYLGLDNTLQENLHLMEQANALGVNRVFTSLHIPETDKNLLKEELQQFCQKAITLNMEIISDVSPATLELLGIDGIELESLKERGINTLRLDYGYSSEEIAALTAKGVSIQLNASTCNEQLLRELGKARVDFSKLEALHNFYPKVGTGLEAAYVKTQNDLLHSFGVTTAAFVPSYNRARSPLYKGLPTIEVHRYLPVDLAKRHLALLGVDNVFIGDSLPTIAELTDLAMNNFYVSLKVKSFDYNPVLTKCTSEILTVRSEENSYRLRTEEGRALFKDISIAPIGCERLEVGTVVINNNLAGRYKGEIEIIKRPIMGNKNINIIGRILPRELVLLDYIVPATKIKIEWVNY